MKTKNILTLIATGIVMFTLTGYGDTERPKKALTTDDGERIMADSKSNILVVYYSRSGRTRQVAHWIQEATKSDLLELKTSIQYPSGYSDLVSLVRKEIEDGVKPELKTKIANFTQYDTIFIGTPIWCGTMAPPVATFLSDYDFGGKTVVPFVTHGGGGESHCVSDMKKLCPKANFKELLALRDSNVPDSQARTTEWSENTLK